MRPRLAIRFLSGLVVLSLLITGPGCARHMPVRDVGDRGGNIGVRVVTVTGEIVTGRLLSLDSNEIVVRITLRTTGEVSERRFPMEDVASATVHRTKSESMWGPVISTVVGVAGGALIAAAIRAAVP